MALIDFITFRKRKPERPAKDQPASGASLWMGGLRPSVSYRDAISAEQAMVHPILFRVLHKLATSVASVPWYIEEDPYALITERPRKSVTKALEDLLHCPNDILAEDQLRYWLTLAFACYGRVPMKIGVSTEKVPNGIYGLDPRLVKAKLDNRGIVKAYVYGAPDGQNSETLPTRKVAERADLGQSYGYEISTPNLSGSLEAGKTVTPLQAAGLPADVINLLLRRAADTAAGHPNMKYIITAEKTLTKGQKQAVEEQVKDSEANEEESGHVLFLYNTKIDLHKLDNDLNNIHSKVPLDDMGRIIAGLFGVPVALMGFGASDGAKFAGNFAESRESFWADTIIPMYLNPIATGLTAAICPYGLRVRFDLDAIESLQTARITRAKDLQKVTFLDDDEKRMLCGFEPRKLKAPITPSADPAAPEPNTGTQVDEPAV